MTLTHHHLAKLVAWLYGATSNEPEKVVEAAAVMTALRGEFPTLEVLYTSNPDAVAVFSLIRIDGYLIVIYRGSYTGRDWLLDILVKEMDPAGRPSIKQVHSGFYSGTVEASDIIMMFYRDDDKIIIAAHSLGAARGEIECEHLEAIGITPHLLVTWGHPAPFKPSTMPAPKYPIVKYRNDAENGEEDPVTYSTDIAGYRHRTPFIDVSAVPVDLHWFDPFALHHFALYESVTPATEVP